MLFDIFDTDLTLVQISAIVALTVLWLRAIWRGCGGRAVWVGWPR